jgi:hypothetical protein
MILHNAAGIAVVLLAMAAAQGRGVDMTGPMRQGGASSIAAAQAASVTTKQGGGDATATHIAQSDARPANETNREASGVTRLHRVNLCLPRQAEGATADWTKFGIKGSITTKAACDAAGGRFYP